MKKLFTAAVFALSMTGLSVFACGGMTQVAPPALHLNAGPNSDQIESAVPELSSIVVLC